MSIRLKYSVPALLQLSAFILGASPCLAAWQNGVSYGGTLKMDLYTPSTVAASPGIVVAIHYCTGNSGSTHSWFQSLADKYGFYIISPDAGKQCFDASASRDGDKAAVVKMVQWVITEKKADKTRVFAAGASSGGCMTNTLIAIYPDVFAGGSALPGFPAGGWPAGDTSCTKCGSSPPNNSAKQWGDIARKAFQYSGTRPRVQQWVGSNDQYNFNGWLPAVVAQFTDLAGLSGSGTKATGPSGWDRTEYKDASGTVMLQTNVGQGKPHDLTGQVPYADVVSFFGLDKEPAGTGTGGAGGNGGASGSVSSGGAKSTGGAPSTGGTKSSSSAPSSGGSSGSSVSVSGGATSSSVSGSGGSKGGGESGSGGATSSSAKSSSGGAKSSSANSSGGSKGSGESSSGGSKSSSASSSGGSKSSSAKSSGGAKSSGDESGGAETEGGDESGGAATSSSGTKTSTDGSGQTGTPKGGSSNSGATTTTGKQTSSSGGSSTGKSSAAGGLMASADNGPLQAPSDEGGCSVGPHIGSRSSSGALAGLLLAAGLMAQRRRRR